MSTPIKPMSVMPFIILGLFGLYTLELGVVGILPMIVERFGVSVAQAGLLMSLFALIVALCGPFLVLVFSRFDRKHVLVGVIDASNAVSIRLHQALGFTHAGTVRQAGFKFGRWLDVDFYQLILATPTDPQDG